MVLSKGLEPPDLLVATLSGVMTAGDQTELVHWVRDTIRATGPVRVLLKLQDFAGWRGDLASFDDVPWLQDDGRVSKLAVVGEPQRRTAVLTALAQPIRRTPIEYFGAEAAARAWLSPSQIKSE